MKKLTKFRERVAAGQYLVPKPLIIPRGRDYYLNWSGVELYTDGEPALIQDPAMHQQHQVFKVIIRDAKFFNGGVQLNQSYGSRFDNCEFANCQGIALETKYGMRTIIDNCSFTMNNASIKLGVGDWEGCNRATAGSNCSRVSNTKIYNMAQSEYGIFIDAADTILLDNLIIEGFESPNPIIYNTFGTGTAKGLHIKGFHFEEVGTALNRPVILAQSFGGMISINGFYAQLPQTLIDLTDSAGYTQVNITNTLNPQLLEIKTHDDSLRGQPYINIDRVSQAIRGDINAFFRHDY